jgi:hypothetical protein
MGRGHEEGRIVGAGDRDDVVDDAGDLHAPVSLTSAVTGRWGRVRAVTTQRMPEQEPGAVLPPASAIASSRSRAAAPVIGALLRQHTRRAPAGH